MSELDSRRNVTRPRKHNETIRNLITFRVPIEVWRLLGEIAEITQNSDRNGQEIC